MRTQCVLGMIHLVLYVKISEICYSIPNCRQCILTTPQHTFNTLNLKKIQHLALVFNISKVHVTTETLGPLLLVRVNVSDTGHS